MTLLVLIFVMFFVHQVLCQCGEKVTLNENQYYVFKSPNYPYNYPANVLCSWTVNAPSTATSMTLYCPYIDIYQTPYCYYDYMTYSGITSGVCGTGQINYTYEKSNVITIEFSSYTNYGSGFTCTVIANYPCKCGIKKTSRIVNGNESEIHEYPWQVALINKNNELFCGGAIISKYYIITSAHCIEPNILSHVIIGEHNLTSTSETSETIHLAIEKATMHPNYKDSPQPENDIALLKVGTSINFNENVHPICLPFNYVNDLFDGETGTVTGWGSVSFNNMKPTDVLHEVEIPIITNKKCSQYHNFTIPQSTMLCTYGPDQKDACQGDSGGPLIVNRGVKFYLVGIVSWGVGCGNHEKPGVYARVTTYIEWIKSIVEPNDELCNM